MVQVDKKRDNRPAWISAAAAVILAAIALLALASEPSEEKLEDHEERIRKLERVTNQALSRIEQQIKGLRRELEDGG